MQFKDRPKVKNCTKKQNKSSSSLSLDTLAQLSTIGVKNLNNNKLQEKKYTREKLQKRAKSKAYTNSYLFDLIDLKSNLNKSYWQTYHCSSVILQEGNKIRSKFCNQRWCLTCNRIRTAKMINGYSEEINKLKDAYFITLTFPNVKAKDLKTTILGMANNLKKIRKNLNNTYGMKLKGLRKYECTYRYKDRYGVIQDDYNPHYHLIIEGKKESEELINLWLKQYPKAEVKAQHLEKVNESTINELCKYFTKVITKDNDYNPKALDIMFRASKGLRTFQPIGIKKKVSEEVQELEVQEIDFKEDAIEIFVWENWNKHRFGWLSSHGEILAEYKPTKDELKVINQDYKHQNNRFKQLSQ